MAVLASLLFPEAFRIMALANVALVALATFADFGVKPTTIQKQRGDEPAFLTTALGGIKLTCLFGLRLLMTRALGADCWG